jgi:hypothetical protein
MRSVVHNMERTFQSEAFHMLMGAWAIAFGTLFLIRPILFWFGMTDSVFPDHARSLSAICLNLYIFGMPRS